MIHPNHGDAMLKPTTRNKITRPSVTLDGLSPDQALSIGAAVGDLLAQGMPGERAITMTAALADFVRRGIAAQQAVDEVLAKERRQLLRRDRSSGGACGS
jgi:hypothetical protein